MKVMADNPLHANLIWKVRYVFHKRDDPHPHYMLLNAGVNAKKMYMRAHDMSEHDFEKEIVHMEALPELYIDGKDAINLCRVFIETLGYKVPDVLKHLFREFQIITHSEFYAKLNVLIDHIEE